MQNIIDRAATVRQKTSTPPTGRTKSSSKEFSASSKSSSVVELAKKPQQTRGVQKVNGKVDKNKSRNSGPKNKPGSSHGASHGLRSSLNIAVFNATDETTDTIFTLFLDTGGPDSCLTEIVRPEDLKWKVIDHPGVRPSAFAGYNSSFFVGWLAPDDIPVYKIFIHEPVETKDTNVKTNVNWIDVTLDLLEKTAVIHHVEADFFMHNYVLAKCKLSGGETLCPRVARSSVFLPISNMRLN
jgi:hypothetical protein